MSTLVPQLETTIEPGMWLAATPRVMRQPRVTRQVWQRQASQEMVAVLSFSTNHS